MWVRRHYRCAGWCEPCVVPASVSASVLDLMPLVNSACGQEQLDLQTCKLTLLAGETRPCMKLGVWLALQMSAGRGRKPSALPCVYGPLLAFVACTCT